MCTAAGAHHQRPGDARRRLQVAGVPDHARRVETETRLLAPSSEEGAITGARFTSGRGVTFLALCAEKTP